MEVSSCKSFRNVSLSRGFAIFTIATVTFSFPDSSPWPFPFGFVDRFFVWVDERTILLHLTSNLSRSICNAKDATNHTLDHDYNFLFCSWNTEDDLLFQKDFSESFWRVVSLRNCLFQPGFVIDFLCVSLSLPCHVRKNLFRLSSTSLLTSQIDNLCLFLQILSKSLLLLLRRLIGFFFEASTCSAVAARDVNWPQSSILGGFSAPFFRTMSCWCIVIACFMSVDFFACRSYKFSRTCSSKSLPRTNNVFSPGPTEHLEAVVVQFDIKQITQAHREPLSLIHVQEQSYLKHYLPAR